MNAKQQRFVEEYLVDSNATQAAIRAGYSRHSAGSLGKQLLENPPILKAIAAARAKLTERVEVTQEFVVAKLVENLNRCMQAVPVLDKEGKETGEWKWEPGAANRALELLGKHLGMFEEKVHVTLSQEDRLARLTSLFDAARQRAAAHN